jgi:polysaccharide export outer membrane protein
VPYAGTIQVGGMSARQIGEAIEARLKGQSQNAQVLVTIEDGPLRSVVLSGDVKKPGRIPLTQANERLLDAIAIAAGPAARAADTLVRLTRGTTTDTARLDAISATSPENVMLAAGDRIELVRDIRTLTVLGSARAVSEVSFDSLELSLSEALARAGGLADEKADPTGVFIFRQEPRDGGGVRPVIYRLNLLEPASYFAAQNFVMRENDIVLVANARSVRVEQFLRMVNSLAAPVVSVDVLTR